MKTLLVRLVLEEEQILLLKNTGDVNKFVNDIIVRNIRENNKNPRKCQVDLICNMSLVKDRPDRYDFDMLIDLDRELLVYNKNSFKPEKIGYTFKYLTQKNDFIKNIF